MIRIIESREQDLEDLRKLFLENRRSTFSWLNPLQFQLSDFDKETAEEYILVALSDEILVGFISIWEADNFIHHLFIAENYQNKNIGSRLLKAAIDKMNFPIRLKCLENNQKAINFYKKKGFVAIEKGSSEMGTYLLFELSEKAK